MRISASTIIEATPEQVWVFITDPENGPRWQEGAVSTHLAAAGRVRLGSEMVHVGRWLGVRFPTRAVVTVYDPPLHYGYDITTKLFPMPSLMRYAVEPVAHGSRLTLSNATPVVRWMRPFEHLLQRNVQGMFERDVARLKAVIEAQARAAAGHPSRRTSGHDASSTRFR